MGETYTPTRADAQYTARVFDDMEDPKNFPTPSAPRVSAKDFGKPVCDEILNLIYIASHGGQAISVRNTGGTLAAGTLVRLSGWYAAGSIPTIATADADTNTPAYLVLLSSLTNNTTGTAYVGGALSSIDTSSAGSVGDPVYLSATAGAYTFTAPSGADQIVQEVGRVSVKNAVTGEIQFNIQRPKKFGTSWLQNLSITNALIAAATIDLTAKVTGVLPVANGGTGAATLTDNGVLYGNATAAVTATAELATGQIIVGSSGNPPQVVTLGADATISAAGALTIANNAITTAKILDDNVTDAKLRESAALSVIGRSANSTGNPADIAAGSNGDVLRVTGSVLGFGQIATAGITNDAVTNAKLNDMAATTIKANATASTDNPTDVAISDGHGIFRRGTTMVSAYPGQRLSKSTTHTVVAGDNGSIIDCDTTSAGFTVTLTAAATLGAGFEVTIRKTVAANLLTIDPNGSETINGASASQVLTGLGAYIKLICDGTNWQCVNANDWVTAIQTSVVSCVNNQFANCTSMSLGVGEWDVSGIVIFNLNSATASGVVEGAISTNSGNTTTDHVYPDNWVDVAFPPATNAFTSIPAYRLVLTATTTVYLKGKAQFSAGTVQQRGRIFARRIR